MTEAQEEQVIDLLAAGYGSEYIEVMTDIPREEISRLIRELRADGLIESIYDAGGDDG